MSLYVLIYGRDGFLSLFRRRYTDPNSRENDLRLFEEDIDVRFAGKHNRYSILFFSFILADTGAIRSIDEVDYLLDHFPGAEIFLMGEQEPPAVKRLLRQKKYHRICRHVSLSHVVPQIIGRAINRPYYGI